MQQQPAAMAPFVQFPAPNLCVATHAGHLVPAELYGSAEDSGGGM